MFKKVIPTDQSTTNTLKFQKSNSGCCGSKTNLKECLYEVTISSFANVASFTIDDEGTSRTIAFDSTITDSSAIKDAIIAKAKTVGYYLDDNPLDVTVTVSGGDVTIKVYGELKVTKFTNAADADFTTTEKCSINVISDYETLYTGGTDPVISVDGTNATVSGTFTNNAAGATALQTAIAAAISGEEGVVVTYDSSVPTLKIVITEDSGKEIIFNTKQLAESNVRSIYVA